jgi:hypothetical protein
MIWAMWHEDETAGDFERLRKHCIFLVAEIKFAALKPGNSFAYRYVGDAEPLGYRRVAHAKLF